MKYLGLEAREIKELLSVVDGPFCYLYL
jgi:hypothetical protein